MTNSRVVHGTSTDLTVVIIPIKVLLASLIVLVATACMDLQPTRPQATPMATNVHGSTYPTLYDLWNKEAKFVVDIEDTGLPMGESDTVQIGPREFRAYVHASYQSAGIIDFCGDPVSFPGCIVTYTSLDQGRSFHIDGDPPQCLMQCVTCPCDSRRDHTDQQQYPRVAQYTSDGSQSASWMIVYEYRANVFLARSNDGVTWSRPAEIPLTGIWRTWLMPCRPEEIVGTHPFAAAQFDCLVGSPPGIYVVPNKTDPEIYVFVGLGQNPGSIGCFRGPAFAPAVMLAKCRNNPLITGNDAYGPLEDTGPAANAHFGFRTLSSAEVMRIGDLYYLLFEGVRGPAAGDAGDTQFALGLARTKTSELDGEWELFADNPIFVDLPGNVGVGHADLLIIEGETYLYTSLDGNQRSRLRLEWSTAQVTDSDGR